MQDINQCIQSIKTLMDEIAAASVQQSEMIVLLMPHSSAKARTVGSFSPGTSCPAAMADTI